MCLVALAWKSHPRWRLFMAGNRDEFHARPTAALARWPAPHEDGVAGRDLRSRGTWMGIGSNGRVAVITNVRDPGAASGGPSRGALVADYLAGAGPSAAGQVERLAARAGDYAPFNLLLADPDGCHYLGNHPPARQALAPGVHGMSNGALDATTRRWTTCGPRSPTNGARTTPNCRRPASPCRWSACCRPPSSAARTTAPAPAP